VGARAGSGRHRRSAEAAVLKQNINFNSRITAGIEYLPCRYVNYRCEHYKFLSLSTKIIRCTLFLPEITDFYQQRQDLFAEVAAISPVKNNFLVAFLAFIRS
jgi:hypothetical protein